MKIRVKISTPAARKFPGRMAGLALFVCAGLIVPAIARGQSPAPAPAQSIPATSLPTITFRRVFKGSSPEFVEIVVREDGAAKADVRQLSDEPSPQEFKIRQEICTKLFDLARQMKKFQGADLELKKRVANMGQKTLLWENGSETFQAQYNYTVDPKAAQLQKAFENLAQEQGDLAMLEERLRYDRLGVNQGLNQFEDDLNHGSLAQPERFLPVLDKIAADTRLIELARQRARTLAARIRAMQIQ
jgi:hypothetical protein